ncbi:MAG: M1 family aminopeptidase [Cyclobacteriaceae bacterium]
MFFKIFSFELKYWFKNPLFYVYCAIFLLASLISMAVSAGFGDDSLVTKSSITIVNSAYALNRFYSQFTIIAFFLLPAVIGGTINKDFSTDTSNVLYSYPFSKIDYLLGKYLSSLTVSIIILSFLAIGTIIGGYLPGTNPELRGPFELMNYLQPYLYYLIPNLIFYGSIIFAVVTFSRNVASGYIAMIVLLFVQGISSSLTRDLDNKELATLLDPFGGAANRFYTQYWSVFEQNELPLPFEGYVLYNRLIWAGVGIGLFLFTYFMFSFSHNALSFSFGKTKGDRLTKNNFGSMVRIDLPKVSFDYSFLHNLKTAWYIAWKDFLFVLKSWPFIIITLLGFFFLTITLEVSGIIFGTPTYPVTWQMLAIAGDVFTSLAILPIVYLYTGMLMQRSRTAKISQLIDTTPVPNWTFLLSKFIAIMKLVAVMLLLIVVSGVIIQSYAGYYKFEIGLYLTELYGLRIWNILVWVLLAILVHTIIPNYLFGFFVTLALGIGFSSLGEIGVEQAIFKYNDGGNFSYSDMNGYGSSVGLYLLYKFYWLLLGIAFYVIGIAFWKRGIPTTVKNRWQKGMQNFTTPLKVSFAVALISFLALGSYIYYVNNVENERTSAKEREKGRAEWEKKYGSFAGIPQPRITSVNVALDLMPESRDFKAKAVYISKNKSGEPIDSIHLDHNGYPSEFTFDRPTELVLEDTVYNYDIYRLQEPLMPGDSITLTIKLHNKPNTWLRNESPILKNGTFINNSIFPTFGYSDSQELRDNEVREKYDLPPKDRMKSPFNPDNLDNTYISGSADWIDFETTISTAPDQIAISPGYLTKEWEENGRRYFHYKMDSKMLNFYAFQSARYEVLKDRYNDIAIEIYYHKGHEYNLDRMMKSIKKSLAYYEKNFSPYQHRQVRIIEFPRTGGGFAQSFANTIPFSEGLGFIAMVDDDDDSGVDYPFSVTSHEVAHQWWAHQVIGADVQGATLMSESLSEYSSLKVLEKEYGEEQMRTFLKDALDSYLQGRSSESLKERPLMFNENQQYIHYNKGSLVLYALSDYIGEKEMNAALSRYIDSVAFQEAPYTTAIEFVSFLNEATPDSLKYLIDDMFSTITLYDNSVDEASYTKLDDGRYEVNISAIAAKYKTDAKGKRVYTDAAGDSLTYEKEGRRRPIISLPMQDWIEVGVFTTKEVDGKDKEVPLYLEKLKFSDIKNDLKIVVDEEPKLVGIDPYNKLIDADSNDNRSPVGEKKESD